MILVPVFAGRTPEDELVVLYEEKLEELELPSLLDVPRRVTRRPEFHLQRPDGEMWALEPGAEIVRLMDDDLNYTHMRIRSQVWSGEARGSKLDLMEAEAQSLPI